MPDIALFASRLNHKASKHGSWKPHPLASIVDAFTLNWRDFSNAYAFPPFCLVGTCLQKVVLQQAILTVVVPLWCTQAWFTILLSFLMDHPRFVRATKGVLHNPILGQMHPLSPKLNLLVCRVSGRETLRETGSIREGNIPRDITDVIMRSWREGTQRQYNVYLGKWDEFCFQRQINSVKTSLN